MKPDDSAYLSGLLEVRYLEEVFALALRMKAHPDAITQDEIMEAAHAITEVDRDNRELRRRIRDSIMTMTGRRS